jgi:Arc/MetJ-type ribon-helix-helix transcriptional regulator
MPNSTLNISLAEEIKQYLDERVQSCEYANADEYIAELLQRDKESQRSLAEEHELAMKGPHYEITAEDIASDNLIERLQRKLENGETVTRGSQSLVR